MMTTHTRQLQQYTRPTNNNYTQLNTSNNTQETNENRTCTKGKNTQVREHSFIVIFF